MKEIESQALRTELGEKIVGEANADFDAPLVDHAEKAPPRRPEVRAKRASKGDGSTSKRDRNDKKESSGTRNFKSDFKSAATAAAGRGRSRPK